MTDHIQRSLDKFFEERTKPPEKRYNGLYRAVVVETNDPLNMYRVRFKCPELHDSDIADDDCPWAVPASNMGGWRAGAWVSPCKGDHVWISFEKGHPYAPVWTAFSAPTRRKAYPYPSVFNVSPVPVNESGETEVRPNDYNRAYLPKDGRPMSEGFVDRYGNMDLSSAIGFYPSEHAKKPVQDEYDPVQKGRLQADNRDPEVNSPDMKYMLRLTKYGNMLLLGDQGYHWKKDDKSELGEFTGDFKQDEKYEIRRWKFVQKFINEGKPKSDQRKILIQTRYGSRFEIRDVGWSKSRSGEYAGDGTKLVQDPSGRDERWAKIRTKGGMLIQALDVGFAEDDKLINRHISQETGVKSEREDKYLKGKDARWIRVVTRHGYKLVLDDAGSSRSDATRLLNPCGNGVLIKGRRPAASRHDLQSKSGPRGYYFEFNEKDELNHLTMGSPLGQTLEVNDRFQYMLLASTLSRNWATKYQGVKSNEFLLRPAMHRDPETTSHHLKIDHENEYIRFKTRAAKGTPPQGPSEGPRTNSVGLGRQALNQGFEARDGANGNGPWVEVVDADHRGLWFSKKEGLGIWRGRKGKKLNIWLDDKQRKIVIHNANTGGKVQISADGKIEIFARNMRLQAEENIEFYAGGSIRMQANGTKLTVNRAGVQTNNNVSGAKFKGFFEGTKDGDGAGTPAPGGDGLNLLDKPDLPEIIEPSDRGQTYNGPFNMVEKEVVSPTINS